MQEQSNLSPWVYYNTNQRSQPYVDFATANGATSPPASNYADKFVEYILQNEETCQKKWFHPREILSDASNKEMALPVEVGRHQGNTFEYNWGLHGNTNEDIKNLIGFPKLFSMGFDPLTILARLIVYMPGHGIPWHRDTLDGWNQRFPQHHDKIVKRKLLMVSDWHWGHMLQLDNCVLSHWSSGDVYNIPLGEWHLSANQGVMPKITVSITGVAKT
jgi:hypothetical protein